MNVLPFQAGVTDDLWHPDHPPAAAQTVGPRTPNLQYGDGQSGVPEALRQPPCRLHQQDSAELQLRIGAGITRTWGFALHQNPFISKTVTNACWSNK